MGLTHANHVVPLEGGINFRDLAGYPTTDGRKIKSGLLFRSGALNELTENDCRFLAKKGIMHIVDYRDPKEIKEKPNVIWSGAIYHNVSANPIETVSADLNKISNEIVKQFDPVSYMQEVYRQLPFNNQAYRFLATLLKNNPAISLVQHCAVGKDRTGIGVAIVLFALGANYQTVMEDYLLTEITLAPFRQRIITALSNKLDSHSIESVQYMFSARQEFLDTAITTIKQRYQTIDNWLVQEFGLTNDHRLSLQQHYLCE